MVSKKVDLNNLDNIIKKTICAINKSKEQIFDISESARQECKRLEQELNDLKEQLKQMFKNIENIEIGLKASRRRLIALSKQFANRSEAELKAAYDKADGLRIELAVKKEQEQNFIVRRNELEIRLKQAYKTVGKAEELMSQVEIAMGYLTYDLQGLSFQLESMQQKQYLGMKIITAQEEERQRVARDIHDGPAQTMSNVVLKADICERLLDVDISKAKDELKDLKRVVRGCLQDVRRIIYDLRPMSLDDLGLVPTIERYVSNYENEMGINVKFKAEGSPDDIRSVISLTTFRIVQESLNNVRKHAQADSVMIDLSFTEDILLMYIHDNGRGFNPEEASQNIDDTSSGFGLCSMRERVELLGGVFKIRSDIGKGTRLNVEIPLHLSEEEKDAENKGSYS
ncbi:MAG: sensor histidine kinase [Firmicutes bacterium]|nr:sensor histidine kinase [Bacillota bacterium]